MKFVSEIRFKEKEEEICFKPFIIIMIISYEYYIYITI